MVQVGGIKDKVLAAHRAGLTRVILPKRNEKDLHDVPLHVQVRSSGLLEDICCYAAWLASRTVRRPRD